MAVCFISVANRGVGPKNRLQKAKTPARWLALSGSGTILPKEYYTLRLSSCQWEIGKIAGEAGTEWRGKSQNRLEYREEFLNSDRSVAKNAAKGTGGNFGVEGNCDGETLRVG